MALSDDRLARLLASLYAGVADATRLPMFLRELADELNAHTGVIQVHDSRHALGQLLMSVGAIAMGSEEMRAYNTRYAGENVWVSRGTDLLLQNDIVSGTDIISPSQLRRTSFYREFLVPLDIDDSVATVLYHGNGDGVAMLTLNRSRRQGPFGDRERAMLRALSPHLKIAYSLRRRLSWIDEERRGMRLALDRLRFGVLLLDSEARICVSNAIADDLIGPLGRDARIECIHALDGASRKRLEASVREVYASIADVPKPRRVFLKFAKRSDAGLMAVVSPLHPSVFADCELGTFRAALFLHRIEANGEPHDDYQWLIDAFGLSPIQARLAHLICQGLNLEECAVALNNRMHTVRTQLKAVYAKTGVSRQAELVAVLGPCFVL